MRNLLSVLLVFLALLAVAAVQYSNTAGFKFLNNLDVTGVTKLGDGGTTNYTQIAADGTITMVGTARVTRRIVLGNAALGKGAVAPAEVVIGNFESWEFDIGDNAVLDLELPPDYSAGTDLTVNVHWYINEAYATNTGEVRWQVAWSALPHGGTEAIDAPTHTGTVDTGDINIPATAKYFTNNDVGTISGASLSVGDSVGLKLSRIALVGGNNPTADPAAVHLEVIYTSNSLGE